ncbi:MAG: glycosyltransferase family 4 protein [Myxococcota bacterium]
MSNLHVMHLPVSPENPYHQLLFESLRRRGLRVDESAGEATFSLNFQLGTLPDVIHLHWLAPFFLSARLPNSRAKALARAACFLGNLQVVKRMGIRLVWTVHNLENHERRFLGIDRWLHRHVTQMADAIIVHSSSARRAFIDTHHSGHRRIHVIPHGHYADWYSDRVTRAEAREVLGLQDDCFVVLFFGAIREYKQVPRLISSFQQASLPDPAKLLVAGAPKSRQLAQRVRTTIGDDKQIKFAAGFIPDELAQVYFRAADVVALPYAQILTSGAAVLSMSFGRPLVVPDVAVLRDLVGEDGAIYFSPSQNNGGLVQALRRAHARRDELDALGAANFERVIRWDWDTIAERTCRIYRRVIAA